MCSHATVTESDLLSLFWDSNLGLILILAWMFNTSELDELFQILNSIKGFKLRQPHRSSTTVYMMHGERWHVVVPTGDDSQL